ncbi:MAG TPA: hypothetical protein VGJ38_08225 [Jatrophihabitantaceae bacterium]|jgi:hypothetical protein
MRKNIGWIVVGGIIAALAAAGVLLLTGGDEPGETASSTPPATVEQIDGGERSRLTLVAKAIERLGIETTPVRAAGRRTVVPYSALLYDAAGKTYVYTRPEAQVFMRESVTVDSVEAELVVLTAGPAAGTAVVSVGAAELYGLEKGIGK